MKDIVIVGMGGFAKEAKWIIDRINNTDGKWNFCGYIDKETKKEDVVGCLLYTSPSPRDCS